MPLRNNAQLTGAREALSRFMNGLATELAVALLIIVSVFLVLFEAGVSPDWVHYERLLFANDVLTWVFVVELTLRFLAEPRKTRFLRRFWIDIIAVLPLFRGFRILRVLRLLRLFRVGMILSRHLAVFSSRASWVRPEYILLSLAILLSVFMGALSIRFAEGRTNPDFDTLEEAGWFAVMTLVGGEPIGGTPDSRFGRLIAVVLMMAGLTVFAIFTATVSAVMVDSLRNLRFRSMEIDEISNHVLICGWNRAAELILDELMHESAFRHFVVIAEPKELADADYFRRHEHRVFYVTGDYTRMEVLRDAGAERAEVAILLADETNEDRSAQDRDARTVLAAMLIEKLNADIYTTVQLLNRDNEASLRRAGVEEVIVSDEYVGNIMATVVRNRGIVSVLDELLTAKRGQQFFKSEVPRHLVGKSVGEVLATLKASHDATLIAVDPGNGAHTIIVNPPADLVLEAGFQIIVAAAKPIR